MRIPVVQQLVDEVASARASLRASRRGLVLSAVRSITEEQVRGRDAVVAAFARRGHQADVIAGEHRAVYRKLARQELSTGRFQFAGFSAGLVALVAFWVGVGWYFDDHFNAAGAIFAGMGGYLFVFGPAMLLTWLLSRLPSLQLVLVGLYMLAVTFAAGLIGYGELTGAGPVRVGRGSGGLAFVLVEGILSIGLMVAVVVVGGLIAVYVQRRRRLALPGSHSLRLLFQAIEMSAADEPFLRADTRRELVRHMAQLAVILRVALWKTVRPSSRLARSVLKHRCALAAQTVEVMGVWVTLPAKTTRTDYQDRMCALAETLMSGRLDELPVEPLRGAISLQSRLASLSGFLRMILIGAVPIGVVGGLVKFGGVPSEAIAGPVWTFLWIWLLVALLSALGELATGRTLFDRTLELFSRASKE
ncbi:hypothetical protein M8542_01265 [Amycolatopsis sp. OK19-0408]|uniref:Uncharacterized protein n=1 Tax=Amycolatopsis iheyensis TaxID=2945988 RepID=A0A9X2SI40_9PSEU|nr:hypothetical protein [Amycolatopsis iheyensis]MCR6481436.1 hypothetical protein [Amycolatopsis iheyensis]